MVNASSYGLRSVTLCYVIYVCPGLVHIAAVISSPFASTVWFIVFFHIIVFLRVFGQVLPWIHNGQKCSHYKNKSYFFLGSGNRHGLKIQNWKSESALSTPKHLVQILVHYCKYTQRKNCCNNDIFSSLNTTMFYLLVLSIFQQVSPCTCSCFEVILSILDIPQLSKKKKVKCYANIRVNVKQ